MSRERQSKTPEKLTIERAPKGTGYVITTGLWTVQFVGSLDECLVFCKEWFEPPNVVHLSEVK